MNPWNAYYLITYLLTGKIGDRGLNFSRVEKPQMQINKVTRCLEFVSSIDQLVEIYEICPKHFCRQYIASFIYVQNNKLVSGLSIKLPLSKRCRSEAKSITWLLSYSSNLRNEILLLVNNFTFLFNVRLFVDFVNQGLGNVWIFRWYHNDDYVHR